MRNKRACFIFSITTAVIAAISAAILFFRRKLINRYSAFALAAMLVFSIAAVIPAYAKGGEDENGEYTAETTPNYAEAEITITIPALPIDPAPEEQPPAEPQTLTPPGNLHLVDDFAVDNDHDMQFITVVTRNGHFFYIIVDRSTDRFNVHFLNQVDEYSLWAILDEDAPRPMPQPDPVPEVIPDPEPEQEPEESGGIGGLLIMLVLVGAVGGGAYYYFKVLKPGQATASVATSQIDEFVFDDDEDDFGNPIGEFDRDYTNTDEDAEPDYITGYNADHEDDMPDFTVHDPADHSEPDSGRLPFESADLGEETPESEDK